MAKKLKLWFDKELAIMLAEKIGQIRPEFPAKEFVKAVDQGIQDLELKDRVELFSDELHRCLGKTYTENLKVLVQILGPENEKETGMFTEFYWIMPIAKYVEKYGLAAYEPSIQAIEEITKRNTGEYCIRPFLQDYPQKTLTQLLKWAQHPNSHVRRLASEGPRPRLPWAPKLQSFIDDPRPLLPILEQLKDDPSKYVQKSVANCLNDILKDHPVLAKEVCKKWSHEAGPERIWIIKHALRNLRKQKDPWALDLLQHLN